MAVASACTKSIPCASNVGARGKVMSAGRRLPNGSQISEGLNRKRSEAETTRTSTSPCSSWLTARAAVSPPKFPPSTSTFLRPTTATSLTSAGSPTRHVQDTYGGIGVARVVGPAMQVQGLAFLLAAFARLAATLVLIGNKAPRLPRIQSRAADGPKP